MRQYRDDITDLALSAGRDPKSIKILFSVSPVVDASPSQLPSEFAALRMPGGRIERDAFDAAVGELVARLGLGRQLLAANRNGAASNSGASFGGKPSF